MKHGPIEALPQPAPPVRKRVVSSVLMKHGPIEANAIDEMTQHLDPSSVLMKHGPIEADGIKSGAWHVHRHPC